MYLRLLALALSLGSVFLLGTGVDRVFLVDETVGIPLLASGTRVGSTMGTTKTFFSLKLRTTMSFIFLKVQTFMSERLFVPPEGLVKTVNLADLTSRANEHEDQMDDPERKCDPKTICDS